MDGNIVNKHGRQLIEFCKATGMLIINGRLGRDWGIGCFTRDDATGRSVVDYAISSLNLLDIIDYFEVLHKFLESDHRPVSLSLTCSTSITPESGLNYNHDWHLCNKYSWSQDGLNDLVSVISDNESELVLNSLLQCITNLCDTNVIAEKLDEYISQACQRVFKFSSRKRQNRKQSRRGRITNADINDPLPLRPGSGSILWLKENNRIHCVANTGHVSKENRENNRKCIEDIKTAYNTNRSATWQVINRFSHNHSSTNEPDDQEFYHHFKELCIPQNADYFSEEYETMATEFLKKYDESNNSHPLNISAIEEIVNDNFSVNEIECAIDSLKTNKSPGYDCIPAEFIKACKTPLSLLCSII